MASEVPPQGSIILYPYRDDGETEGRKKRPICLVLRLADPQRAIHHLMLLAISSQPPRPDQVAMEVPDTERRRAGLSRYPRAWIVLSEYNYDIAEQSWYYEPNSPPLGAFSAPFVKEIAKAVRAILGKAAARVDRTR
jgi:hypothetical protein